MKLSEEFAKRFGIGLSLLILGIALWYLKISWEINDIGRIWYYWYNWWQGAYPKAIYIFGMTLDAFIITRIFFRLPAGKIWNLITLILISGMSIAKWYFSFWYWRIMDCSFCRWDIPLISGFVLTIIEVIIVIYAVKLVYLFINVSRDKVPIDLPKIIICFYLLFMIDGIWQCFYVASFSTPSFNTFGP